MGNVNAICGSAKMKQSKAVNFLKGFSICTIVLMHLLQSYPLPGWAMKATAFGGAGVHVFILCSGFGLYLSHLNKPLGYKDFLRKRAARVYWPMAIVCMATTAWMAFEGKEVLWPLLGNLLLFKMFVPELETSMGVQMWFVSTIIQFYLAWPLILRLMKVKTGGVIALVVSLLWSTVVGLTGHAEERVWNSFFLQYLWEFYLGMKLAEWYVKRPAQLQIPQWKHLLPICVIGMVLTGTMGWLGFPWKLYNDIPSLVSYMTLALIFYKIGITWVNDFFCYTNRFSYEWYLVHILMFQVIVYAMDGHGPVIIEASVCFVFSYLVAMGYGRLWNKRKKRIAKVK